MKFRKKPVVVEAIRVNEAIEHAAHDWKRLPAWLSEAYESGKILFLSDSMRIDTLEGRMIGSRGDWLICGVQGEIYPCKPDIFAETYEAVVEAGQ